MKQTNCCENCIGNYLDDSEEQGCQQVSCPCHQDKQDTKECVNGHKMTGIGFDDCCPECEGRWKQQPTDWVEEEENAKELKKVIHKWQDENIDKPLKDLYMNNADWEKEFDEMDFSEWKYEKDMVKYIMMCREKIKSFIHSLLAQKEKQSDEEFEALYKASKRDLARQKEELVEKIESGFGNDEELLYGKWLKIKEEL